MEPAREGCPVALAAAGSIGPGAATPDPVASAALARAPATRPDGLAAARMATIAGEIREREDWGIGSDLEFRIVWVRSHGCADHVTAGMRRPKLRSSVEETRRGLVVPS